MKTKIPYTIIIFFLFFFGLSLWGEAGKVFSQQQVQQQWVRRFSDTSSTSWNSSSIKSDYYGNIYILAESGNDFGYLKYDSSGNLLQVVTHWPGGYSSGGGNYFNVSPNGNVVVTGTVNENFYSWMYTVKFNSNGVFQWGKFYNPDNYDEPEDIKVDNNGNIIIVGGATIGNTTYALTIKYNSNGDTLWTRYFNPPPNYSALNNKLVLDDLNNIYITGFFNVLLYLGKCSILKYSSLGVLNFFNTFTMDSTYNSTGQGIALDNYGNIYVLGAQLMPPNNSIQPYLLKLTNGGVIQWGRLYGGTMGNGNQLVGPVVSSDGNSIYYSTEAYNGLGGGSYSIATLKYNSVGDSQWVRMFNGGGIPGTANYIGSIKLDKYGNVYICGTGNYQTTGNDFATIKYSPLGEQQWVQTYTGIINNGGDYAYDLIIDSLLNVYVTGISRNISNNGYVSATIKYSQLDGVISNKNEIPLNYKLFQNYPNPFNPTTKIDYQLPKSAKVVIKVYDILGKLVKELVNENKEAGFYTVTFDGTNFASGVYFYRIEAGDFVQSKKMVLIK